MTPEQIDVFIAAVKVCDKKASIAGLRRSLRNVGLWPPSTAMQMLERLKDSNRQRDMTLTSNSEGE